MVSFHWVVYGAAKCKELFSYLSQEDNNCLVSVSIFILIVILILDTVEDLYLSSVVTRSYLPFSMYRQFHVLTSELIAFSLVLEVTNATM